jgi:hypothetical protein
MNSYIPEMKSSAPEWSPSPVSTMNDTNSTIAYELLYTGNQIKCSGMAASPFSTMEDRNTTITY